MANVMSLSAPNRICASVGYQRAAFSQPRYQQHPCTGRSYGLSCVASENTAVNSKSVQHLIYGHCFFSITLQDVSRGGVHRQEGCRGAGRLGGWWSVQLAAVQQQEWGQQGGEDATNSKRSLAKICGGGEMHERYRMCPIMPNDLHSILDMFNATAQYSVHCGFTDEAMLCSSCLIRFKMFICKIRNVPALIPGNPGLRIQPSYYIMQYKCFHLFVLPSDSYNDMRPKLSRAEQQSDLQTVSEDDNVPSYKRRKER